jgi:hypothetical protein
MTNKLTGQDSNKKNPNDAPQETPAHKEPEPPHPIRDNEDPNEI